MDTVQNKSAVQIQRIVNAAEEFKNTRNDLNRWVKDVKDKEQKLSVEQNAEHIKTKPIRSHISKSDQMGLKTNTNVMDENKVKVEEEQENKNLKADESNSRGNNHVKRGEYEKAILEYSTAINAYDGDPKFYTNRALCYLRLKKYAQCIDDCNTAIELDKLTVKAYYRRMQANESLNFNTQALKDCTTILMIDSSNIEAQKSLQRINQRLKKTGAVPKGYQMNESNCSKEGPNFSPLRSNIVDIFPATKLPSSRSKKQMKRIKIIDVVGPKDGKNYENSNIQISDEVIDKLFNGECGSYEEVKKSDVTPAVKHIEKDTNICLPTKMGIQKTKEPKKDNEIPSVTKEKPLPPAPTTTAQFYSNWKELSAEQKYQYLKSIQVSQLNRILGVGLDSETLSSLLTTFSEYYLRNEDDLCETLLEVCKHSSLKILSLMLSTEDEAALSEILNYVKKEASPENLKLIEKSFNLK
ncbi:RNA polymerase II-associated protein 3 [Eupeodes corollae]|uniref:RNA polymerase II-associated protein 3 n=1 Tax=Eupeodes corollae TaxID=290404 RepID=UPI0024916734|nr:RNA polymerase II-associated protein 3 [Eupeodes corollae]